jgi:hypothetical protein
VEDHSVATYQEEEEGYEDYSQYQDDSQMGLGNNGDQNIHYDKGKKSSYSMAKSDVLWS